MQDHIEGDGVAVQNTRDDQGGSGGERAVAQDEGRERWRVNQGQSEFVLVGARISVSQGCTDARDWVPVVEGVLAGIPANYCGISKADLKEHQESKPAALGSNTRATPGSLLSVVCRSISTLFVQIVPHSILLFSGPAGIPTSEVISRASTYAALVSGQEESNEHPGSVRCFHFMSSFCRLGSVTQT